jgi:uncharacterized cupredoxin-like copper-binding protein
MSRAVYRTAYRTVLLASGLLLAACGGSDSGGAIQPTPTQTNTVTANQVNVVLAEWSVTPTPATATEGQVLFNASNDGTTDHELMVIGTELAHDKLPVEGGLVDEKAEGLDVAGEIEAFPTGQTEDGIFALDAGAYVLICNVAGHYQEGMHAAFIVT